MREVPGEIGWRRGGISRNVSRNVSRRVTWIGEDTAAEGAMGGCSGCGEVLEVGGLGMGVVEVA